MASIARLVPVDSNDFTTFFEQAFALLIQLAGCLFVGRDKNCFVHKVAEHSLDVLLNGAVQGTGLLENLACELGIAEENLHEVEPKKTEHLKIFGRLCQRLSVLYK